MKRLALLSLSAQLAWAQPPHLWQSPPGQNYEVLDARLQGDCIWVGGTVRPAHDPGAPLPWSDAFLCKLDSRGKVIWQKTFGSQGGDSLERLLVSPAGDLYLVGRLSGTLKAAWAGQPTLDWSQECYLARVSPQGQLLQSVQWRAQANSKNQEPYLKLQSLCWGPDGKLWVGGSLQGKFAGVSSADPHGQAFVARLAPDLSGRQVVAVAGNDVGWLCASGDGKVLGAGVCQSRGHDPLQPPTSRPQIWSCQDPGRVRVDWRGPLGQNTRCLQLEPQHLLWTQNDRQDTALLRLPGQQLEALPPDVMQYFSWQGQEWALGLAVGPLVGTEPVGGCDTVLWRRQQRTWTAQSRFGTEERDFLYRALVTPAGLQLLGESEGNWPGCQPATGQEPRMCAVRLAHPPRPEEADILGMVEAQSSLHQLSASLASLQCLLRPGFDHFAGWMEGGPVITGESGDWDSWALFQREGPLQRQGPSPLQGTGFPLDPQVYPRTAGPYLMCREPGEEPAISWFRLDAQGQILDRTRLKLGRGCWAERATLGAAGQLIWGGQQLGADGQAQSLLSAVDARGQQVWCQGQSFPEADPSPHCRDLAGAPDGQLAALWQGERTAYLRLYTAQGQLRSQHEWALEAEKGQAQALAWVNDCWWCLTGPHGDGKHQLSVWNHSGAKLWDRPLPLEAHARVEQMLPQPGSSSVWLIGSQGERTTRGLVLRLESDGRESARHLLPGPRSTRLLAGQWQGKQLWLGGEICHDSVTDAFWGVLPVESLRP